MTLIILSDDALLMQRIQERLSNHCPTAKVIGNCYTVADGLAAVEALRPELVVLDMEMPAVKKDKVFAFILEKGIHVIALTTNKALLKQLQKEGVRAMLTMPFDELVLSSMLV